MFGLELDCAHKFPLGNVCGSVLRRRAWISACAWWPDQSAGWGHGRELCGIDGAMRSLPGNQQGGPEGL